MNIYIYIYLFSAYTLGEMKVGANKCIVEVPIGKCQEGVQAIASKNGASQSRFLQGSWGHLPPGCSIGGYGSKDNKY